MSPIQRSLAAGMLAALVWGVSAGAQQGQLVDRVVAVVAGTIVTMTDARAAVDFGFVDAQGAEDPVAVAVEWLVDRQLVLDEAVRYGIAPPEQARVDEEIAAIRVRIGEPQMFAARLAALGLSEDDLRLLVRRHLLVRAYLDRRFDATLAVTENEAQEYYRLRVDQFVRDGRLLLFDEARAAVYEAIVRERRERAVAEWLTGLRRRGDVSVLYGGRHPGPGPVEGPRTPPPL
jgi:parvulin-like peptidyl-prolyl isomerase